MDSLREDMDSISGTLYDMTQMRVPEGEVVIYDASRGVCHCPLWSSTLIRLLRTAERTGRHVFHAMWVVVSGYAWEKLCMKSL